MSEYAAANRTQIDVLNQALHGTVNSVIQYIEIAVPYVPEGHEDDLKTVQRLQAEEAATAHAITERIAELDGTPKAGVFPYWNVDLNYLDLRFLCRFAGEHTERVIAVLETGLRTVEDDPKTYGLIARILEEKRAHLAALQALVGEPEAPAAD